MNTRPGEFNIMEFGAVADGRTLNTQAIQLAIDACADAGGGNVVFPGGIYRTGTLVLRSHTVLDLRPGAVLEGSPDICDYPAGHGRNMYRGEPEMDRCLIYAADAENIGVIGSGKINGNGSRDIFPNPDDPGHHRPMLIRFVNCRGIRMRDVTLCDPAGWTSAWLYCEDIVVDGITIHSRANGNGDGLDFDGCRNVRVSNCSFDTSDDCICLQTSRPDRPCRDVTVCNCTFCSRWAGIRIGLLSRGDFENVTVTNCIFRDITDAGLKIQMCEGAVMQNMIFSNLMMQRVPRPLFLTLGRQRCCVDAPGGLPPAGKLRRLHFCRMLIDNSETGPDSHLVIAGLPECMVEDITISDISMVTCGGATDKDAEESGVPELSPDNLDGHWPEYYCFKRILPAAGLYARHVRGLVVRNLDLKTVLPDPRKLVVMDDVLLREGGGHE